MNNPFYFALPAGARQPRNLWAALAHIRETFYVTGRVEFVRRETGFDLFRVVSA